MATGHLHHRTIRRKLEPSTGTAVYRDNTVKTVKEICSRVNSLAAVKRKYKMCVSENTASFLQN